MDKRNLVLTGFMATGKTSVGRRVAQKIGREFVDLDQLIAARTGMTVADIFARHGEEYFRGRERELCAELAAGENLVIATGGGALVDPRNRAQFNRATVICLEAGAGEILRRLHHTKERPLLNAESEEARRERISGLLEVRRTAYGQIPIHVDTTGRTVEEVARRVVELFISDSQSRSVKVQTPEGSYSIHLGRGLLGRLGEILPRSDFASRCAVVTNPTVAGLYGGPVVDSLRAAGFEPALVEIPDGEEYKTLETLRAVFDQFVLARLERRSLVAALGGGVVGDLAGFAASTYLRGVPFVQIPTTLLAVVDASIGGKVAVDHPAGKNLIGAFKFPHAVIADVDLLQTLPPEESRAGLAEVIKHAIIGDAQLFQELARAREMDAELLARAIRVKVDYVERDPFEANVRVHLNLGHTFGHALETLSGYRLRHGYAVAIGTAVAARQAARTGWCEPGTRDRILELLTSKELPTQVPPEWSAGQIIAAMNADKKNREGRLRLILPVRIGQVEIAEDVPHEQIAAALEESRGQARGSP